MPAEAYLTLIDFKDIVKSNWQLCASICESISGYQGKDKATNWIIELNEVRKWWAHPVKQKHFPLDSARIDTIKNICEKVFEQLSN